MNLFKSKKDQTILDRIETFIVCFFYLLGQSDVLRIFSDLGRLVINDDISVFYDLLFRTILYYFVLYELDIPIYRKVAEYIGSINPLLGAALIMMIKYFPMIKLFWEMINSKKNLKEAYENARAFLDTYSTENLNLKARMNNLKHSIRKLIRLISKKLSDTCYRDEIPYVVYIEYHCDVMLNDYSMTINQSIFIIADRAGPILTCLLFCC